MYGEKHQQRSHQKFLMLLLRWQQVSVGQLFTDLGVVKCVVVKPMNLQQKELRQSN